MFSKKINYLNSITILKIFLQSFNSLPFLLHLSEAAIQNFKWLIYIRILFLALDSVNIFMQIKVNVLIRKLKWKKKKPKKQIPRSQNQIIDLISCSEFICATAAAEVWKCHQVEWNLDKMFCCVCVYYFSLSWDRNFIFYISPQIFMHCVKLL